MHRRISIALRERHVVNATLVEDDAKNISRAMFVWHSVVVMMLLRHHATQNHSTRDWLLLSSREQKESRTNCTAPKTTSSRQPVKHGAAISGRSSSGVAIDHVARSTTIVSIINLD